MYVVIVEFTIHPECWEDFIVRVKQQAADSLRLESDCHVFDLCVSPDQANLVLLYEIYSDRESFDAHLESAHFRDFSDAVQNWVSGKKVSIFEKL